MKTENNSKANVTATETEEAKIPAALLKEAVGIVRAAIKQQHATALFGGRVVEAGFAFRQVMTEACKVAGLERSRIEGLVSNANPFIAPARLVARGEMTEKQFALLKHKEASAAFKAAGGVKDGGLEPTAWQAAFEKNSAAAAADQISKSEPEKKAAPMKARDFIAASIEARANELTNEDIDALVLKLSKLRK
jgi:cell division ATPase FtsA